MGADLLAGVPTNWLGFGDLEILNLINVITISANGKIGRQITANTLRGY